MAPRKLHPKMLKLRWVIWFLAAAFYFYEFILRVSPSVLVPELESTFNIQAGAVGTLSAFYLFAYAPMQLPAGILMDRFGARRLLTFASIICGLGAILFGISPAVWILSAGRFLMGIGSAFAFVGMIYICYHWFEGSYVARLAGLGNSIGMLGGVGGEGPLAWGIDHFGWRATIILTGIWGVVLGLVIYLALRSEPDSVAKKHAKAHRTKIFIEQAKSICKNLQTWLNACISFLFYAPTIAFAALWAVPFIQSGYDLGKGVSGLAASMIYVGWIVGGPIMGHISDSMGNRKVVLRIATLFAFISMCLVIYIPNQPVVILFFLYFLTGIFLSAQNITYILAIELNPIPVKGSSLALTNFFVFLAGSVLQPLVGVILDKLWDGRSVNNVPVYTVENYQYALTVFPVCLALAFLLTFFIKEKKELIRA